MILPISYYDTSDYIKDTFKLAQSGYSYLIPSLAIGITQKDLVNLKDLENNMSSNFKEKQNLNVVNMINEEKQWWL